MGVLIRSGVDPDSAAERVGLAGVKFTGALPVSLRLPASDANILEGGSAPVGNDAGVSARWPAKSRLRSINRVKAATIEWRSRGSL